MLVLTRKCGESVVIRDSMTGEELLVMVVRSYGPPVRLGFEGHKRFTIIRSELTKPGVQSRLDSMG